MFLSDDSTEVVVTDVVAPERRVSLPLNRLSRVRCVHCAMPARGTEDSCWSCGLDPARPLAPFEGQILPAGDAEPAPRASRWVRVAIGGLVVLLAGMLVTMVLVLPGDDGHGVRGLAARLRGEAWKRAGLQGATADFPSAPVRRSLPAGPGQGAEGLVASAPGLRVELWVVAGTLETGAGQQLVDGFAAAAGGRLVSTMPGTLLGAPALDAVVDGPDGPTRLRAAAFGSSVYLMAVTGSPAAFERFNASFQPAA